VSSLPVTPLHYPLAKIIHIISGKASLSLPALFVGAMVPDLEVPFLYFLSGAWEQDRLVLHSFLGGLTIGTLLAVALTVFLYPTLVSAVFPVDKTLVKQKCRFSKLLVVSCLFGVLSHVLLDVANHIYNPIFWPFLSLMQTPSPVVVFLGGKEMASIIVHGSMLVIVAILLFKERGDWNKALVG
jgi:membrane-bound metal-dependent hydrolase YbcI (DUF457 family)